MILIRLFLEFFHIGLFTIGGGLAALPLLREAVVGGGWATDAAFVDMIAVSQSTPGPIGINMATYCGFVAGGVPGAVCATAGICAPSLIIVILIARFMQGFAQHPAVRSTLAALRPTSTGLIAAAVWFIVIAAFTLRADGASPARLDGRALLLGAAVVLVYWRWRPHPIAAILAGGVVGTVWFWL